MAPLVSNRLCGELQQAITALAWSPDNEFLAIASAGGELLPRRGAARVALAGGFPRYSLN